MFSQIHLKDIGLGKRVLRHQKVSRTNVILRFQTVLVSISKLLSPTFSYEAKGY